VPDPAGGSLSSCASRLGSGPEAEEPFVREILMTSAGLERLASQLVLLHARRELLTQAAASALQNEGATAENAEYADAQHEQMLLERQIAQVEARLAAARVVAPTDGDGRLQIGESARVCDLDSGEMACYRLVGDTEADAAAGRISYRSPVGAALHGRRAGETVTAETPAGTLRLEILEVEAKT
jgi:transcription elongation factor GreA